MRRELAWPAVPTASHDVIYFTDSCNVAPLTRNIRRALDRLQLQINGQAVFPVVKRDGSRVVLHAGAISHADLQIGFAAGIDGSSATSAPSHFIRFTSDSPICLLLTDVLNVVHQGIIRKKGFTTRD